MTGKIGTFNYPGGKTTIADWIIQHIPQHEVYVEPFGGSAGVMANKPESPLEVYNDTASLCVDFFRAVKHHPDDLQHWVQTTPYSRELYNEYQTKLQENPPDDVVERAGMFWHTTQSGYGGIPPLSKSANFGCNTTSPSGNTRADNLKSAADNVESVCQRFRTVQIENLDYVDIFKKYDSQETVFYCDPPYVMDRDDFYNHGDGQFNHANFVDYIHELNGMWIVSYNHNIPDGLRDYTVVDRGRCSNMDDGKAEKTESLVMNFDPTATESMADVEQNSLDTYQ